MDDVTGQAVLDGIPAAAVLLDASGRIAAVNRAWLQFCVSNGGDVAAVSPPADYLAACAATTLDSTVREVGDGITAVTRGGLPRFEFEYPCHGPTVERWFRMTATPIPGGVLVIHHDISGEYARVSRWLATTPIAIVELDAQGDAVYVNAAWSRQAGQPTHSLLGSRWADHLGSDRRGQLLEAVHETVASHRDRTIEVSVPNPGQQLWMRYVISPYADDHGTLRRISVVGLDITDARQLTAQLETALTTRVVVEQAKGYVARATGTDPATAFHAIRRHARDHRLKVHDLCRDVVAGDVPALTGAPGP